VNPLSSANEKDAAWPAIVAEASAWIAMMHGPGRTPAAEQGLRRWLEESPLHAQAFELATDTWNEARASVKRGAK
jgi:ferric-dicitrate binding protein FerR (iron transport regulator)